MDGAQEEKINKLREYFEGRDDVVMAFLFGSQAKGYARPESDWDIGVF
ncbi:MAG: nucleotidyltransferase domain-containing protein [Candidatus Sungbacteria bacterium]|nr:nucleotidyltransferase domain-containing protein [Candidatus Sungbacteria bacterium]